MSSKKLELCVYGATGHRVLRGTKPPRALVALVPIALLPHLHFANLHLASALLLPRRKPLILGVPKVVFGSETVVGPGLSGFAVLKPAIGASNSNIQDQIEVLVKRRRVPASLTPRVNNPGAVAVVGRKVSAGPERLVKWSVEDLEELGIDIRENIFLGPFYAEGVLFCSIGRVESLPLHVGFPPSIVG